MSLQLILGSSGAGKSHHLYSHIIEESARHPERNYIVVVPEQYTMAIQKRMVSMHPRKGILNIDVVSFERLAYKVFEEVGEDNLEILDDTGKNLIIKRVLEQNKSRLKFFGSNLSNTGFVSEMKSVISEMLQYDIRPEAMDSAAKQAQKDAEGSAALKYKLDDIVLVYNAFMEYIDKNYITKEEILDKLCCRIEDSRRIRNCEIAFDGFTGFTPVQYKLLTILLKMCPKIFVTLTIDINEKTNVVAGREELFYMSKDCIARLHKICDEEHVNIDAPILIKGVASDVDGDIKSDLNNIHYNINSRFNNSSELQFLEQNIFRNHAVRYNNPTKDIVVYEAASAKDEITFAAGEIVRLTRLSGYRYNEIAIVTADMDGYGKLTANILKQNDIPFFLDYKRHVTDNPFIAAINGALGIIEKGYDYESVFGFLKTGMTGIAREDIDLLDNYCVAVGIRGRNKWHEVWTKKFRGNVNNTDLEKLNELRKVIIDILDPLEEGLKAKDATVADMVRVLYDFLVRQNMEKKVSDLGDNEYTGDEYAQLYKKVIEVLDKMYFLLGTQKVSMKEFNKILASGFEEIKIGLIPQTGDCVVIGDIERTRLDNIKVMFFVGVNDGNVPKKADSRSVLSETDREYLENAGITMSPSVREKAFTQRFYLYLIMTKSSEKLYMSYAVKNSGGEALMPSYIIRNLKKMFPQCCVITKADVSQQNSYVTIPRAATTFAEESVDKCIARTIITDLTGGHLVGSVTSFENYAECQLRYFLRYGLDLREREEFTFSPVNFGVVLHAVIKEVCDEIKKNGESYYLISEQKRRAMVEKSVEAITDIYQNSILKDSNRNEFMVKRMEDLADRTLWAMGQQLKDGAFVPVAFEHKFSMEIGEFGNKQMMSGTIDRIDMCEDADNVYVRIIDYKTGKKDFNLTKTYYGIDIQLMVYMEAAMRLAAKMRPGKTIVPAGVFYYNISDPIVSASNDTEEEIEDKIKEELRLKGMVNSDKDIAVRMDSTEGTSLSIPVSRKADGSFDSRRSRIMSTEQFTMLGKYVDIKAVDTAGRILDGSIERNPYRDGQFSSCDRCPYNAVCGFSADISGCDYRRIKKFDDEVLWNNIREGVDENGKKMD